MKDLTTLPSNLPVPVDDGACAHLEHCVLPSIPLPGTADRSVNLATEKGISVVYFYPLIGHPDSPPMPEWNEIPGARGCTPQSCAFRDLNEEFKKLGARVFGASSQTLEAQKEAAERLHLPFELLNDSNLELTNALDLPRFHYKGMELIKRLTLIIDDGVIIKVFYPVFPPNQNATDVIAWLTNYQRS